MKTPAFGLGEHYRTDGKGHFRLASSLSYRKKHEYPHSVGRALSAKHAKLLWEYQQELLRE